MRVRTSMAQLVHLMRPVAMALAFTIVVGAIPRFDGAFADASAAPASADTLWTATFKDTTGTPRTFENLKGKISVVYFWATWCAPCQTEAPLLKALYESHRSKGVEVLGIALDNADKVKDFVAKHQLPFTVVYGGREAIQLGKDLGNSLGGIPYLVVIGRDGRIVERITGEFKAGRLEGIIDPLLAG